ncbi:hypothetical protein PUN4_570004 [Paraburkholderia unamae]|nr:hypothetical protein PUN4_570004 [Paraburkholderia unamae]
MCSHLPLLFHIKHYALYLRHVERSSPEAGHSIEDIRYSESMPEMAGLEVHAAPRPTRPRDA